MGVDDPLRKPRVEPKCGRTVRERGCPPLGVLALAFEHVEVFSECIKALEQFPPIGVLGSEEADDRLVLDAREAGGRGQPGAQGVAALVGERVVRAGVRAARLLAGLQVAGGITLLGPPGMLPADLRAAA